MPLHLLSGLPHINSPAMSEVLYESALPFPVRRGKVRDVYDLGDTLLIVATDRISAFDCVMPNGIPGKGKILTALSRFWFDRLPSHFAHHLLATDVDEFPEAAQKYRDQLTGRSMLVKKAHVLPIECVARGYLAGSGWKEYQQTQTVCGVQLPPGLRQCDKLPEPIFTPATKEETGHDINISFKNVVGRVGMSLAQALRDRTLSMYRHAADYGMSRGIIIADTKFEFGLYPPAPDLASKLNPQVLVVDEMLTPDSSRFWPADQYEPGRDQQSFDKQFVRNWLQSQPWDKTPPAPRLSDDIVETTRRRYVDAYEKLTGTPWDR